MNIKDNYHYKKLLLALDDMEGISGPDQQDYINIVELFAEELKRRAAVARELQKDEEENS